MWRESCKCVGEISKETVFDIGISTGDYNAESVFICDLLKTDGVYKSGENSRLNLSLISMRLIMQLFSELMASYLCLERN